MSELRGNGSVCHNAPGEWWLYDGMSGDACMFAWCACRTIAEHAHASQTHALESPEYFVVCVLW